jgi:hypothetical protein
LLCSWDFLLLDVVEVRETASIPSLVVRLRAHLRRHERDSSILTSRDAQLGSPPDCFPAQEPEKGLAMPMSIFAGNAIDNGLELDGGGLD